MEWVDTARDVLYSLLTHIITLDLQGPHRELAPPRNEAVCGSRVTASHREIRLPRATHLAQQNATRPNVVLALYHPTTTVRMRVLIVSPWAHAHLEHDLELQTARRDQRLVRSVLGGKFRIGRAVDAHSEDLAVAWRALSSAGKKSIAHDIPDASHMAARCAVKRNWPSLIAIEPWIAISIVRMIPFGDTECKLPPASRPDEFLTTAHALARAARHVALIHKVVCFVEMPIGQTKLVDDFLAGEINEPSLPVLCATRTET